MGGDEQHAAERRILLHNRQCMKRKNKRKALSRLRDSSFFDFAIVDTSDYIAVT
jgi:hypothetical protein